MIRICFAIHSLQPGGTQRVMVELINYLVEKEKVEAHLLLYGKSREIFHRPHGSVILHQPDFTFNAKRRIYSTLKTLWFIRKKVRQIAPDTILSMGEYWNSFILLSLYGLRYPVFISDRCQPDKSLGKFHDRLRKWLYPKAEGIIAQTTKAEEVYQKQNLNKNICVIGNPIYQVGNNGSGNHRENIVLSVGRLIESKHHDRLIKMFKNTAPPGWKLVIAGGDAQKQHGMEKLQALVKQLKMEHCVELPGTVADIDSYYRRSKIFAFTSSSEGFPNVIGEAMSAGLPVIAYDCMAGPSDLIEDEKNGFLIPTFNDEKYSAKLMQLFHSEDLRARMGRNSFLKASSLKVNIIAEQFLAFINKEPTYGSASGEMLQKN